MNVLRSEKSLSVSYNDPAPYEDFRLEDIASIALILPYIVLTTPCTINLLLRHSCLDSVPE